MAALGMETHNGDFEVIDLCFAGLPEVYQPEAGPSGAANGKGKTKAENADMADGELVGTLEVLTR